MVLVVNSVVGSIFYLCSFHRGTTLQIVGFNPEYYLFPYSDYSTSKEGLKIEMLYRKVGTHVWSKAYNTAADPVVLLDIRPNSTVSVRPEITLTFQFSC